MNKRRYAILDRDGTVIEDKDYLSDPNGVELCPNAGEGLRAMASMGLGLAMVTNQSGIARGYFRERDLEAVHRRMTEMLAPFGVRLEAIYHCPHGPEEGCSCRKPATALVDRAARELGLDPTRSFVIGDKPSDIELGRNVRATTILVRTGNGSPSEGQEALCADYVVDDLLQAASVIRECLRSEARPTEPSP